MSNAQIELNHDEFAAFLKSDVIDALEDTAAARTASVDGNFQTEVLQMPTRAVMKITCVDDKTWRDNLENNTLLKVIK